MEKIEIPILSCFSDTNVPSQVFHPVSLAVEIHLIVLGKSSCAFSNPSTSLASFIRDVRHVLRAILGALVDIVFVLRLLPCLPVTLCPQSIGELSQTNFVCDEERELDYIILASSLR